jgi:hypothetical protein
MKGTVTCATADGPRLVPALLTEHLAIHRSLGSGNDWTITHRPTGCALSWRRTRREALQIAVRIEAECAATMKRWAKLGYAESAKGKGGAAKVREVVA